MPHRLRIQAADNAWWFGFAADKRGDLVPSGAKPILAREEGETYRGIDYMYAETVQLARQLKAIDDGSIAKPTSCWHRRRRGSASREGAGHGSARDPLREAPQSEPAVRLLVYRGSGRLSAPFDEHGRRWPCLREYIWCGRLCMARGSNWGFTATTEFLLAVLAAIDRRVVYIEDRINDLFGGAGMANAITRRGSKVTSSPKV